MPDFKAMPPNERLAYAREKAGYSSATDAARAFGWNENTYRSHENGERGLRLNVASRYAAAFGVTPEFLIVGGLNQTLTSKIPLIGRVDQAWNVKLDGGVDSWKTRYIADLPIQVGSDFAAVEVSEVSYLGVFRPKDLIIVWFREAWNYIEDNYAIILPEGGRTALRYVQKGTMPGHYDLSYPAGPYERNVALETAMAMHLLMPRSQWFKRDTQTGEKVS